MDQDDNESNYGELSPRVATSFPEQQEDEDLSQQQNEDLSQQPQDQAGSSSSSDDESDVGGLNLCEATERRVPTGRQRDWESAKDLKFPTRCMPTERFRPELLTIPSHLLSTMDAYGKCWKPIEHNSDSLMVSETDGASWIFCQGCVSDIPRDIQQILYFFHMLMARLQDLRNYAVPTQTISLKSQRDNPKVIDGMLWHKSLDSVLRQSDTAEEGEYIDMNECMSELSQHMTDSATVSEKLPPLKIRLGFTGVLYEYKGEKYRKIVCVLMVTWARNFDLLGYIQDSFLKEPCYKKSPGAKAIMHDVQVLSGIWKMIRYKVAYIQLGLDESRFGVPDDYTDNRAGEMGMDSLHNMFQLPNACLGIVRDEIFEREQRDRTSGVHLERSRIQVENFRIIGLPALRYNINEEATHQYLHYMRTYIMNCNNDYVDLVKAIKNFYKPKEKQRGNEEEGQVDQNVDRTFTLNSPGGWPLEVKHEEDGTMEVLKFGAPPLPIWHQFNPGAAPDIDMSFENWLVDIGGANGLPELTKTCLRSFYVQDLNQRREEVIRTWEIYLQDKRLANPALLYEKYYSSSANPLASIVVENYLGTWWNGVSKDITLQRKGGLSIMEASKGLTRYLHSAHLSHITSIQSGIVRSDRLAQAMRILNKTNIRNVCTRDADSIYNMIHKLSIHMSADRKFDMYQRTNEAFWKSYEYINQFFLMNSSNLEFMVETMVSQVMWMESSQNPNIVGYFQCIMQTSGNGHYSLSTKDGVLPDRRKPNSTGADFTREKVSELFQMQMDRVHLDERENLQAWRQLAGWTDASLPLTTHAAIIGNKISSLPNEKMSFSDMGTTEMRGPDMKPDTMIKHGIARNRKGANGAVMLNTVDPNKTNQRQVVNRERMRNLQLVCVASNVPDMSKEAAESSKTLTTVMHVMPPGSEHYHKRQKVGPINNLTCSSTAGRQVMPKETDGIVNMLPFSHMWTCVIPALMNHFGVIPMNISPTTLALLDWVTLLVKESSDGIIGKDVMESFNRMKDGYEARQVGKALWTKCMMYLGTSNSEEEAVNKVLQTSYANIMPVHDAICVAHSFLTRSIHMGALMMVACIVAHLEVPIIPLDNLKHFFDTTESHDGVHHAVASRIKEVFGMQLVNAAHMGPEVSIYWNALLDMMHLFNPDFRQLISNRIFATKSHLVKLGLHDRVAGIQDWPDDAEKPPPFARSFTFLQPGADPSSHAIGVHWAALLLCVSFTEDAVIHPKISSNFARNILKEILKHSPPAATPGNNIPLRSFNLNSGATERVILSAKLKRPAHFLRPIHDIHFASTGVFNLTRAVGRFAPEDCLHCGSLFKFAELYACDILDLPGRAIFAEYELIPNKHYTILRQSDFREGTIVLNSREGKAVIGHRAHDDGVPTFIETEPTEWVQALRDNDFIITPMIFRHGACVAVEDKDAGITDVGCLVPFPSGEMIDPLTCEYSILLRGETTRIHFSEVLTFIIPLGTLVFLNLDADETRKLKLPLFDKDKRKHWIGMRVNVPTVEEPAPGRVYLTCTQRSIICNTKMPKVMVYTIDVDPANIRASLPDGEEYATELYLS